MVGIRFVDSMVKIGTALLGFVFLICFFIVEVSAGKTVRAYVLIYFRLLIFQV